MTSPSSHLKTVQRCTYLCLWWQIVWCWNMSYLCQLYTISSYLCHFTSISNCTFPFEHIPSSHSHLYSILLTLLYILPLTQLGCVCLPRLIVLFVYLWVGLVLLFVCEFLCFGFLVAAGFLLFCRNSTSFPVFPHITSGEQRNSKATPLQIGSQEYYINHHPNAKNTANNL